tara:strand:- start:360 stop:845 length:486 start_codon:yes stop_codon:yes gene_type:complete
MALLTSHIHGPSGNPSGAQGGIIQIKQTVFKTPQDFSTTNSYFDTGLTASITPTSSGNHVLCHFSFNGGPNNAAEMRFRLVRASTVLDVGNGSGGVDAFIAGTQDGSRPAYPSAMLLDTGIATTSATTYKLQLSCTSASHMNKRDSDYRACSVMTLFEVSA